MSRQNSTQESATDGPTSRPHRPGGVRHALDILGKRRRFLVNKKTQLRAVVLATLVTGILLVLLNVSLYSSRAATTEAVLRDSPELRLVLDSQNRTEMTLILAASIVFLAGVFVVTILETHKTAGAALNVKRHLELIRDGVYTARLKLREGDNLGDIETAFNEMVAALEHRALADAAELERLASSAESLAGPDDAVALALELRTHAGARPRV